MEEGQRLVLLDQVKDWCADSRTKVTVKPVIDLNADVDTDAYAQVEVSAPAARWSPTRRRISSTTSESGRVASTATPERGTSSPVRCRRTTRLALRGPRTPLVTGPLVEPAEQGVQVDLEHEDVVEQVDEVREVAGAAAEEGHGRTVVGDQLADPTDVPEVVLVQGGVDRPPGRRVSLVGEVGVTVDGVVTASPQLVAHGGLPGPGHALDQVVADAHGRSITATGEQNATRESPLSPARRSAAARSRAPRGTSRARCRGSRSSR